MFTKTKLQERTTIDDPEPIKPDPIEIVEAAGLEVNAIEARLILCEIARNTEVSEYVRAPHGERHGDVEYGVSTDAETGVIKIERHFGDYTYSDARRRINAGEAGTADKESMIKACRKAVEIIENDDPELANLHEQHAELSGKVQVLTVEIADLKEEIVEARKVPEPTYSFKEYAGGDLLVRM